MIIYTNLPDWKSIFSKGILNVPNISSTFPFIINHPDYIGINPNEAGTSFELVKVFDKNIQIGIKLDIKDDYLYVATLHSITNGKLQHGLENGRLKKFDINE